MTGTGLEETDEEPALGVPGPSLAARGTITDYVSGQRVKATPEETDAVQVFSRRLVEDYGYPKAHLRTRPQYRVKPTPSGSGKSYPIDIAVFAGPAQRHSDLRIVVECKRRTRRDGLHQLKTYLDMCPAELGVWFNGEDHHYVRKVLHPDGSRSWEELPNIPRHGQRIEDIGRYRRQDLVKPSNLRAVFRDLRNHLAGNAPGITRDEALAQEVISLLFCKIYDEVNTGRRDAVEFRCGHNEAPCSVEKRILDLFDQVKVEYPDVFDESDRIHLDSVSLAYIVGELQPYCVTEADRDAIGEAFEVFIGPALRGAEGQFFTPRNVVRALVEMVDPKPGEMVIDPACGSGGFLTVALEHVWQELEMEGLDKGWSPVQLDRRKREVATRTFRGLDKDSFLAKVTKAYMAIIGDGRGGVFRVDSSLQRPDEWPEVVRAAVPVGRFDVVLTNPPFGKKIRVTGAGLLSQFDLGHKWEQDKVLGRRGLSTALLRDQAPQMLFLERCLDLLKPGGRLGIILPESLFGSPSYGHIVEWLMGRARVIAVVAMPEALFKTSGKIGTHTKVCIVVLQKRAGLPDPGEDIFMADAKWCGHDSRGNDTLRRNPEGTVELLDDVPVVADRFRAIRSGREVAQDHLGFTMARRNLAGTVLIPKYYDPELQRQVEVLAQSHDMAPLESFGETLRITTGIEVGKMAYGTGDVPFIRTSDLSNWELKADPKQGVSEDLYAELRARFADKLDVREGDILMVKDGTYLVGTSAVVSRLDTRIIYQSHLYKIRVEDPDVIDPWLLFAALNSPIVKRQIRAKRFTQDIIDSLGNRLLEIRVPIPKDLLECQRIATATKRAVTTRAELREEARVIAVEIEGRQAAEDDLRSLDEAD